MIKGEEEIQQQEARVSAELVKLKSDLEDEELSLKARAAILSQIHDKEIAHTVLAWILGDTYRHD